SIYNSPASLHSPLRLSPLSVRQIGTVMRRWTHATNSRTPSSVTVRSGQTASHTIRSCDTVSARAFFPQVQLEMPQEAMRQHRRQPMAMPARLFADCIVVHPQLGCAFFAALFHGPAQTTSTHPGAQGVLAGT